MAKPLELLPTLEKSMDSPKTRARYGQSRLTELDGKTWLQYSISVWNDIRKTSDELALRHPAMFPSALPGRLIEMFTKRHDLVLDPFAGTGSTLIAASERNRRAIGIEISGEFINLYKSRLKQLDFFSAKKSDTSMHQGDATNLGKYVRQNTVQLTVTSPPYWDILNQDRSADGKSVRNYGQHKGNLGNIEDYQEFVETLRPVFSDTYEATKTGGYCCVVVMDIRKRDKYFPFHMDLANLMANIGFELDDIVIWDRRQEYNNLRPLGYPSVFRINKIHEYILIFFKR